MRNALWNGQLCCVQKVLYVFCATAGCKSDPNMTIVTAPLRATFQIILRCSRIFIDIVTDIVFQWIMVGIIKPRNKLPGNWRIIPPVGDDILMQSATNLARRIRLKEVILMSSIGTIWDKWVIKFLVLLYIYFDTYHRWNPKKLSAPALIGLLRSTPFWTQLLTKGTYSIPGIS